MSHLLVLFVRMKLKPYKTLNVMINTLHSALNHTTQTSLEIKGIMRKLSHKEEQILQVMCEECGGSAALTPTAGGDEL